MNNMRIGGVSTKQNTSDILTKSLQPPIHAVHCSHLHILTPTITTHTQTLTNNAIFTTLKQPSQNKTPQQLTHKEAKKQKRKVKKQRQRERQYRLVAHARQIANRHYKLTNHETANLVTTLSTDNLTSNTTTPFDRHLSLQMQLESKPTTQQHRPMPTPTAPRQTCNVNQPVPGQRPFLPQKVPPHTINDTTRTSHSQLPKPHLSRRKKVLHPLHFLRRRPNTRHRTIAQERRHREQHAQKTPLGFPPQFFELLCPTHTPETHILQAHVRCTQPTNQNPPNKEKRHTHRNRTPKHTHTTSM